MHKSLIAPFFVLIVLFFFSSSFAQTIEENTDRPGMNINNFDLPRNLPTLCRQACQDDPNCKAWTYVHPGIQGPKARCWLKSGVPAPVNSPCCVSGVREFKMSPALTPKTANKPGLNPLSPPMQVLFPSKNSSLNTGETVTVKWKMNYQIAENTLKFRIDLLDSKKTLIKELTNPGGISFPGKLPSYQYDRQIPLNLPNGKYLVKISLLGPQGVNGESGLFDIQNVPHLAGPKGDKLNKGPLQQPFQPPPLVNVTDIKLISLNPVFYGKKLAIVEMTVEITTDRPFKLAGFSPNPKDPINYAVLQPKMKLVLRLFPIKTPYDDIELVDFDLAHDNPFFSYPKNMVMNAGKNTVKFTINVHPSMESKYADLDGSWWGPLTVRGAYDNKNCLKNVDFRVQAYIYLENFKKESKGLIPHVDVTGPRDEKEAKTGFYFFKFFDINCK
ncbi:MAG: hypothetical protein EHM45_23180 [Desulfobacteraceae bacterium]|nr:MAG: hypothetical protein EHM45_23180 [Desulfobacteraceae bacterium]